MDNSNISRAFDINTENNWLGNKNDSHNVYSAPRLPATSQSKTYVQSADTYVETTDQNFRQQDYDDSGVHQYDE